jgi:hypothetical protein
MCSFSWDHDKKCIPIEFIGWSQMHFTKSRVGKWGDLTWCTMLKKQNAWKHMKWFGMSKWAQSLALEPVHDLKCAQWGF